MGFEVFYPQNERAVKKYGSQYGTSSAKMVYNGPFVLKGWKGTNDTWTLVKNSHYWDHQAVKLDEIHDQVVKTPSTGLNLYQSQKLDQTTLSGQEVANEQHNSDLVVRKTARLAYLEYNQKQVKALANVNIRKAMSLVINRQQLVSKVLGDGSVVPKGFVTTGLANVPGTNQDYAQAASVSQSVAYNVKQARQYWKKGLAELGVKTLSLSLLHDDSDAMSKTAEYLQGQFEKELPGFKVTNMTVPYKTRLDREMKRNFQLVISAWSADFADPISDLQILTSDNAYNFGGWKNQAYDRQIALANQSTNTQQRWAALVAAGKILGKDQEVAPLYQPAIAQLVNPKLKGLVYNTAGTPYSFKNTYLK